MFDFEKLLALISAETVLCVGDLMLDEFVYGEVERISPEAPAPVLAVSRSELVIGGAGNVARNIAALGARCIFVGVVGSDDAGRRLTAELRSDPSIEVRVVVDPTRITTRKVRSHMRCNGLRERGPHFRPHALGGRRNFRTYIRV